MKMNKSKIALAGVLLSAASGALAQTAYVRPAYQFPSAPAPSGPAALPLGDSGFFATPYLGAGIAYDDNIFQSRVNERSSTLYMISPGVSLESRGPGRVFQLRHQSQIGRYQQSSEDNYIDHATRAQFDFALDRRNFLRLGLDHIRGHDPRGSTDRPIANRPDKYRLTSPSVTYAFGAPGAPGRVELYGAAGNKDYTNNRSTTFASDRDTREFGGAFYWRVQPRTYLLAEARRTDISYKDPASLLSAEETRYYAGVTWEATAATTGTLKVGKLERRFDRGPDPNFDSTSWEALITWAPRTYSKFDIYSARQTNESTGLGRFILTSVSGVSWNHNWSSVLATGVEARYQKDEFQGFNRKDDLKTLGVRVGYKFRRWLTLGAEYTHTQRDSNQPLFEFDKNFYLISATASM